MSRYEIRQSGRVLCVSTIPGCGHSPAVLRDMARAGLVLYRDGKRVQIKESERTP